MIEFANSRIEDEWDTLHPKLQQLLEDFGHWSASQGLITPVVTCLLRTKQENRKIYGKDRFSWHLLQKDGTIHAADIRTKHYTKEQSDKVIGWFLKSCMDTDTWELITKVHGTGPHIHVGVRK